MSQHDGQSNSGAGVGKGNSAYYASAIPATPGNKDRKGKNDPLNVRSSSSSSAHGTPVSRPQPALTNARQLSSGPRQLLIGSQSSPTRAPPARPSGTPPTGAPGTTGTPPSGAPPKCVSYNTQDECNDHPTECAFIGTKCLNRTKGDDDEQLKAIYDAFGMTLGKDGVTDADINKINEQIVTLESLLTEAKTKAEEYITSHPINGVVLKDNLMIRGSDITMRKAMVNNLENRTDANLHQLTNVYNNHTESTYKVLIGRIELMQRLIKQIKARKNGTQEIDRMMRKAQLMKMVGLIQGTHNIMSGLINAQR